MFRRMCKEVRSRGKTLQTTAKDELYLSNNDGCLNGWLSTVILLLLRRLKVKYPSNIFSFERGFPSQVKGEGLKIPKDGLSFGVGLRGFKSHPPHY